MGRISTPLVTVAVASTVASCGEPERLEGGHAVAGGVVLRSVSVQAPEGGSYQRGDDAVVRWVMFSGSERPDALLGVRTRRADQVELRLDEDCDGKSETVPRIPVPVEDGTVGQETVNSTYHLRVVDFAEDVPAGTTVPLTFIFENAGETTVQAVVQEDGDTKPTMECTEATGKRN